MRWVRTWHAVGFEECWRCGHTGPVHERGVAPVSVLVVDPSPASPASPGDGEGLNLHGWAHNGPAATITFAPAVPAAPAVRRSACRPRAAGSPKSTPMWSPEQQATLFRHAIARIEAEGGRVFQHGPQPQDDRNLRLLRILAAGRPMSAVCTELGMTMSRVHQIKRRELDRSAAALGVAERTRTDGLVESRRPVVLWSACSGTRSSF